MAMTGITGRLAWYVAAGVLCGALIYLVPAPSPGLPSLFDLDPVERLRTGRAVQVSFDACPESDEGWHSTGDYLGTILCGGIYTVWYVARERAWHARGPNEALLAKDPNARLHHSTSPGVLPSEKGFTIWGARFTFSDDGEVAIAGQLVGHLQLTLGNKTYRLKKRPPEKAD